MLETRGDVWVFVKKPSLGPFAMNPAMDAIRSEEQVANSRRDGVYTDVRPAITERTVGISVAPPALTADVRHRKIIASMGALPGNLVLTANRNVMPSA